MVLLKLLFELRKRSQAQVPGRFTSLPKQGGPRVLTHHKYSFAYLKNTKDRYTLFTKSSPHIFSQ